MNRYSLIIILVFVVSLANSQSISQINKQLDSLNNIRKTVQVKIKDCQDQLHDLKQKIDDLEAKKATLSSTTTATTNNDYITAKVMAGGAILRDTPSSTGKTITTIPGNETIYVFKNQQNLYFKVSYKSQTGYVSYSTIAQNQEIDDFLSGKEPVKQNISTTTIIRKVDENDPRYLKLVKLYGKDNAIKIMNNELWQGMSYGMVLESIGKPNSKNQTNTDDGIIEKWLYNDYTLDFANGELKNWTKK
jgi:hypothetical protein